MKTKIVNGFNRYYNDNDKYLMSYSTMTKPFTQDKFDNIPAFVLQKATDGGKNMSNLVLETFSGVEVGEYTQEHKKCLKSLVNALKTLNLHPLTIEKHIYNDKGHGYLDIDCEECFIEMKTRSKCELELNTIIQCEVYKRICGKEYVIIYLNKKTGEDKLFKSQEIPGDLIEKAHQVITALETIGAIVE